MQSIDTRCLEPSVYDYLTIRRKHKWVKAVGTITEKQLVFYSQIKKGDTRTHDDIYREISGAMYEGGELVKNNVDNVGLAAVDTDFFLFLPDNRNLSYEQFYMLSYVLNQIKLYNNEQEFDNEKITIQLIGFTKENYPINVCLENIDEIIEFLQSQIVDDKKSIKKEKIIGKTLNEIRQIFGEYNNKKLK